MSEWFRQFKHDLSYRWRDGVDRWRALPRPKQWQIAGSLCAAAAVSLTAASWYVFARTGAAHKEEVHSDVVLYTSADSAIAQPVIDEFEKEMGIHVKVVFDTEATKTTGLIAKLVAERAKPKADVWWSSEPMGSVRLAQAGMLDPYVSKAEMDFKDGWPKYLRAKDKTWYGFAQRVRVIAFCTNRLVKMNVPTKLRDLTAEKWHGKVGMARPQFGSTFTHIAALVAMHGEEPVREWVKAMQDNGLKLYDGNSAVVTALANGEIEIGLTDNDDVWAARREHLPVDMVLETLDKANPSTPVNVGAAINPKGLPSVGPLVIPNTVGKIKGCPHPNEAGKLADFLLSPTVESMLAESDSHNIPVRPAVAKKFDQQPITDPAQVDPAEVERALPQAERLIKDLFPLQ